MHTSTLENRPQVLRRRAEVASALAAALPRHAILSRSEDTTPYECDGLTAYRAQPLVVVLPETEAQVAAVLQICHQMGVPIVARGAGTGLSGGAMPHPLGVGRFVAQLLLVRGRGACIWLCNVHPGLRRCLQQLGLAERSALLICPDHVKNSKPDPEPLILACKMLDLDPASVLFVGDDLRDIESGRDAGTRTAAVTYGYIHPDDNPTHWGADVVVDHPLELRQVLDQALCSC